MITDPIANAICSINNSVKAKKPTVSFYSSKVINEMLQIMKEEGYISDYIVKINSKNISFVTVYLKYKDGVSAIRGIKRVSKPGYRIYTKSKDLPIIMNGMGTAIISTNQKIMCEKKSRKLNLGGEIMAYIW